MSVLAGLPGSEPFQFDAAAGERILLLTKAPAMGIGRPRIWQPDATPGAAATSPPPAAREPGRQHRARRRGPAGRRQRTRPSRPSPKEPGTRPRWATRGASSTNSKSASSTTRVVRLTREWTRSYTIGSENVTTARGSARLGIHILDLTAEAERAVRKNYSASAGDRESFAEEVTLNIPPHTKSEIVFSWKEIRQNGTVRVTGDGFEAVFPYEIVVGITFDQQQVDA
jgi:hypothetical protein